MAISPLEAQATELQLIEAQGVEAKVVAHLRRDSSEPFELEGPRPMDMNIVLCIVAERFRRTGWHVVADPDAGRLIFNDATPEF